MALSIMNNSVAIGAMGNLNKSNSALGKTLSQMSSGLRINSAADDASGLAVSEKLRGQIKGLGKAASNAQDAISLLQTAEGAMGSMTDILQRMRELAVQAGDPAYTTNDRSMLQLEVDQLKSEVNRISTSTEFNTKKLLNGDAAGVWSSDNAGIEAILRGAPAEGNYKIESNLTKGDAYAYKSGIMNMTNDNGIINGIAFDATTGIEGINTRNMMAGAFQVGVAAGAAVVANTSLLGTTGPLGGSTLSGGITTNGSGYLEVETLTTLTAGGTGASVRFSFTDALTGKKSTSVVALGAGGALGAAVTVGGATIAAATVVGTTFSDGSKSAWGVTAANAAVGTAGGSANIVIGADANSSITVRFADVTTTKGKTVSLTTAQWDGGTNGLVIGKMDISFAAVRTETAGVTVVAATTATTATVGGVAMGTSKLNELTNFVNADGRNVLANAQKLSIYGNGQSMEISIEGSDSINDLLAKLNGAFKEMGYGDDVAQFVTSPISGSDTAVQGTFVFKSDTLRGDASKISFVGDQGVLNGLGVNTIKEGTNNTTTVKITDAHGIPGKDPSVLGKDLTVTDGMIRDVIKGVDIKIDITNSGMTTSYLHIQNTATKAAIGANEGQTLDISIGRMDTTALEIDSIVVATFEDSQKAITKLDKAMETLSRARATAGAQMNRLDYTINNLNNSKENLTAAESRLRDLDIAQASTDMTAQQVRLQAATAMLAQANQLPSYAAQLLK